MKSKALGLIPNILIAVLLVFCVYGIVCSINNRPISVAGYQLFVVRSGSMEPELRKFDLTLVKKTDASQLKVGDIITYIRGDGVVITHRICSVTDDGVYTKGDALDEADDYKVAFSAVYGKNVGKVRYIGAVFDFFQSGYGIALCVAVVVGIIVLDKTGKKNKSVAGPQDNGASPDLRGETKEQCAAASSETKDDSRTGISGNGKE